MEWINVKDKLPEPTFGSSCSREVLIWPEWEKAFYNHATKYWIYRGDKVVRFTVTHWMPLPERPV